MVTVLAQSRVSDTDLDSEQLSRLEVLGNVYGVGLSSSEAERVCSLTVQVLEGEDPHADQVGPVDALVALCYHSTNAL